MSIGESSSSATGTSASSRRLGAAFLGLLHSHVELFGIELQEQKARTVSLLLFAGLALVFGLLLLVGLSGLVLIVFWDTYRLPAIIGLCVFYAPVSYTHLRAHETGRNLVCRLLLEKKKPVIPA